MDRSFGRGDVVFSAPFSRDRSKQQESEDSSFRGFIFLGSENASAERYL